MSATDDFNMRRTVLAIAIGAAGTFLMSPGRADDDATNGEVMFVRWIARGTGPKGPFEAVGVDRLIVPNGYVAENLILSDHPIFADFAKYVGNFRGT